MQYDKTEVFYKKQVNMAINTKEIGESKNTLYENVSSDQIRITEDKLKLKLEKFEKSIKRSNNWLTWFGIFLMTVAALNAASFVDALGISGVAWETIFTIIAIVAFIGLIISPIKYYRNKITIDNFIDGCKKYE